MKLRDRIHLTLGSVIFLFEYSNSFYVKDIVKRSNLFDPTQRVFCLLVFQDMFTLNQLPFVSMLSSSISSLMSTYSPAALSERRKVRINKYNAVYLIKV